MSKIGILTEHQIIMLHCSNIQCGSDALKRFKPVSKSMGLFPKSVICNICSAAWRPGEVQIYSVSVEI